MIFIILLRNGFLLFYEGITIALLMMRARDKG